MSVRFLEFFFVLSYKVSGTSDSSDSVGDAAVTLSTSSGEVVVSVIVLTSSVGEVVDSIGTASSSFCAAANAGKE